MTDTIILTAQPEAGQLPDYVDENGFPWWDEPARTCHPRDYLPTTCPICGADMTNGVCHYDATH